MLCDAEIARHFATLVLKNGGSDCWYRMSVNELLPERYKNIASKLVKGNQIFDCWFDNSLSWDFVLRSNSHNDN